MNKLFFFIGGIATGLIGAALLDRKNDELENDSTNYMTTNLDKEKIRKDRQEELERKIEELRKFYADDDTLDEQSTINPNFAS